MQTYIIRRLLAAIPTIFGITVLIFLAMRVLPGDPFLAVGGEAATSIRMTEEQVRQARAQLGIDRPYWQQYLSWMGDIARGEFGRSFWRNEPVIHLIARRAPISAEIALLAIVIAWVVGIPVGVLSAARTNSVLDYALRMLTVLFLAVPGFWLGILIVTWLVLTFLWRPPIASTDIWADPWGNVQMIIGPALVLGMGIAAVLARFSRSSMLEVLGEDYVRTARAKGLPQRSVIWPHTLKNAMLPTITVTGAAVGGLLGGAVAVETAFSVPGLGLTLVQALNERDWTIVQNLVLLYGVVFTLINLAVDISYSWFDPRIRYA
ncbi:MAG: ABC transporter permease [Chloroflexota bacterium]